MKRIIIAFTLLLSVLSISAFANDGKVSPIVQKSFQNFFSNAKDVKWTTVENLYQAEFNLNGQDVVAFYNVNGKLVASGRHITAVQLPVSLQFTLNKEAANYNIVELFELNMEEGTTYYATLDNASKTVRIKSVANDQWSVYKKTKK